MEQLLMIKQQLTRFYTRFEVYIVPALKFITMLFALIFINANVGFMSKLKNPAIVLILSLLCSFLPANVIVVVAGLVIIAHVYALSLNAAVIILFVMMIMYALYFRFTPKDAIAVILTPIAYVLKIPYVMPLAMGFLGTPVSGISIGCGSVVYFMLRFLKDNEDGLTAASSDPESALAGFKGLIDGLVKNPTMILYVIAFAVTVCIVYVLRRLAISYSAQIALGTGFVINMLIIFIGAAALDADISVVGVLLGSIVSLLLGFVIQFFVFNLDYLRTETVQFEDDEYYYYVKAVPKMGGKMEMPSRGRKSRNSQEDYDDLDDYYYE